VTTAAHACPLPGGSCLQSNEALDSALGICTDVLLHSWVYQPHRYSGSVLAVDSVGSLLASAVGAVAWGTEGWSVGGSPDEGAGASYIALNSVTGLSGDASIEVVIKIDATSGSTIVGMPIFDCGANDAAGASNIVLSVLPTTGFLQIAVGVLRAPLVSTTPLPRNVWTHVVATISSNGANLFIDGVLATSSSSFIGAPPGPRAVCRIAQSSSATGVFRGEVRLLKLFGGVLTEDMVAVLRRSAMPVASVIQGYDFRSDFTGTPSSGWALDFARSSSATRPHRYAMIRGVARDTNAVGLEGVRFQSNVYVQLAGGIDDLGAGARTITMYFRAPDDAVFSDTYYLFSCGSDGASERTPNAVNIYFVPDGTLHANHYDSNGLLRALVQTPPRAIRQNTLHFVTAVFSPTAPLALSVDAGTLYRGPMPNAPVSAVPRPACFIGASHSPGRPTIPTGSVALFEIYGGELDQERIQSLHFLRKHARRAVVLDERHAITSQTLEIPPSTTDPSATVQSAFTAIALGMCHGAFGSAWVIADFTDFLSAASLDGAMPSALELHTPRAPRLWVTNSAAFYETAAVLGGSQNSRFYYLDGKPPSGTTTNPKIPQSQQTPWTLMAGPGKFRVLCRNTDVGPVAVDFDYRSSTASAAMPVDRAGGVVTAALGSGAHTGTGITLNQGGDPPNAFVTIGDTEQPVLVGGALTIAMIIKEEVFVEGASVLWCTSDSSTYDSLIVEIGANHQLKFTVQYGTTEFSVSSPIDAISTLTRSHVVASIDGLQLCLFVNGFELNCEHLTLNPADWNPNVVPRTLCYHGKDTNFGAGFKGEISLLRINLGPTDGKAIEETFARDFPFLEHQWDFRRTASGSVKTTIADSIAAVTAVVVHSGSGIPLSDGVTWTGVTTAPNFFISLGTFEFGGASTFEFVLMWHTFSEISVLSFSDAVGRNRFSFGNDGGGKELKVSYTESATVQTLQTVGQSPVMQGVRYHAVVVVKDSLLALYVNGREILVVTALAVPQPAVVDRSSCFLGKSFEHTAMDGEITSLKIYSGSMNAAQAKVAYERSFLILEHSWDFSQAASNPKNYADLVGNGGDAISASGVEDATAVAGYATFTGVGLSYIGITSMAGKTGGPMTVQTRVRFDAADSDCNVFVCHSGSNNDLVTVRVVSGKLEVELDATTLTARNGRLATSSHALALNVWTDIVVTFDYPPHGISIYVDGTKVGQNAAASVPTETRRYSCSIGDGGSPGLQGAMTYLKLYSGAMRFGGGSASTAAPMPGSPSMAPTVSTAPTSAPVTSAPTSAPVTAAPISAAPTAPTSAPTSAPTNMLGALVDMAESPLRVSEYSDTPFTLLTVKKAAAATALAVGERATIVCAARSDFAMLSPAAGLAVTHGGSTLPMGSITATLVDDAEQHAFRTGVVNCSVRAKGRATQYFESVVRVAGVAQPSYRSICPVDDSGKVNERGCDTKLTTAGNATIAIIGGICAACPQPPFHATTTVVIGGVPVVARITDGGTRLLTRTPTMREILAARGAAREVGDSDFGQYYLLDITTPAGEQGEAGGSVAWGALALRSSSDASRLACNPPPSLSGRAFCPDVAPKDSGVYYTKLCDGFLNPDLGGWDTPNDPETQSLFAYGFPPNCIACPFGCHCPGGARCRAAPGYVADSAGGDTLGDSRSPIPCHPDRAIALLRCAGWSDSAGATTCEAGYTGELCASCASGFYAVAGGICNSCPTEANAWTVVLTISAALASIFTMSFALVAAVQLSFGRSIGSGAIRSTRFAGWTVAILATQSQIGRTRTGKQPPMLEFWFDFLKIFEANPDGVRPSQCSGSTNSVAVLAMATSLVCVLVFALLGVPILGRAMSKLCTVACRATVAVVKRGVAIAQRARRGVDEDEDGALALGGALRSRDAASSAKAVHFGDAPTKVASAVVTGVRANPMLLRRAQVKSKAMQAALGDGAIELTELRKLKSSARLIVKGKALSSDGSFIAGEDEGAGSAADRAFAAAALGGAAVNDFRPKRGALQLSEKDAMLAAVARFHAEREDAATSDKSGRRRCCARTNKKVKAQTPGEKAAANNPARKKVSPGARCVGITRKMLGGTIIILHPLVANVAFRHVYCVQKPGGGEHGESKITVLATDLSQRCFDEKHLVVWMLAWATIVVCIIGFPLLVIVSLSRSAGWWRCQCKPGPVELRRRSTVRPPPLPPGSGDSEHTPTDGIRPKRPSTRASFFGNAMVVMAYGRFDPDGTIAAAEAAEEARNAAPQIGSPGYEEWPGPVHGGLCCRCARCVRCLERSRNSFNTLHDSSVHPARTQAWTGFTKGDYRPEHFWVRLVFYCSITLLSFSNAFLNPDYLVSASQSTDLGADTAGGAAGANAKVAIVAMQLARFALCGVALFVPCAVLVLVVPNKHGSRWKLPLRLLCAFVSFAMLGLNLLSYTVQSAAPLRAPTAPRATGALLNSTTISRGSTAVVTSASLREQTDAIVFADNLAYVVLAMSWILLIAMAAFFVIFVVFRGAESQARNEEAVAKRRAEETVVDAARLYLARRRLRRVISGWRDAFEAAAAEGAQRGAERPRFRASKIAAFAAAATSSPSPRAQGRPSLPPLRALRRSIFAGVRSAIQNIAQPHPMLPVGWARHHDGEGDAFYFCDGTGERSCDTPVVGPDGWLGITAARGGSIEWSHAATQRKQRGSMPDALPDGWGAVLDGASGRIFYHNVVSDETAWETPSPLPDGWTLRRMSDAPYCSEYYHSSTGRTSATVPPRLLPGWAEAVDEETGDVFYVHAESGKSRWEAPLVAYGPTDADNTRTALALPAGWEAHREAEGRVFYLNTRSGVTQWAHPCDEMSALEVDVEENDGDAEEEATESSAEDIDIPGRKQSAGSRFSGSLALARGSRSKRHTRGKSERPQSQKQRDRARREVRDMSSRKFVNLMSAWKKRGAASLSDALLGSWVAAPRGSALTVSGGGGAKSAAEGGATPLLCPPLLKFLLSQLFVAADLDMDGTLSTIELTNILRRRAGGTDLEGNASAMFKLRTLLASQGCVHDSRRSSLRSSVSLLRPFSDATPPPSLSLSLSLSLSSHHGEITKAEFQQGMLVAISMEPNGPAAQWIMIELMDESARWVQSSNSGETTCWTHPTHGRSASKPDIVAEVERCYVILGVG
jgi:hypothetical protein